MSADLAFNRYVHANMRLKARYGVEVSYEEFLSLCNRIKNGVGIGNRTAYDGYNKEVWIEVKGTWVCAQFKTAEGLICTFLPCPPPNVKDDLYKKYHQEYSRMSSKKIADAARKMVDSGVVPKDNTTQGDVDYLREQMREATRLIMQDKDVKGAVALLDAISKVPPNMLPYSQEKTQAHVEQARQMSLKFIAA